MEWWTNGERASSGIRWEWWPVGVGKEEYLEIPKLEEFIITSEMKRCVLYEEEKQTGC